MIGDLLQFVTLMMDVPCKIHSSLLSSQVFDNRLCCSLSELQSESSQPREIY